MRKIFIRNIALERLKTMEKGKVRAILAKLSRQEIAALAEATGIAWLQSRTAFENSKETAAEYRRVVDLLTRKVAA